MPFPVGIDNLRELIDEELDFVDKTLFLRNIKKILKIGIGFCGKTFELVYQL